MPHKRLAHPRGMKFGAIYDGGGREKNESDEIVDATSHSALPRV